jgi:GTP-binding protein
MFTDRVRLTVRAGRGGNGVVAWRRERFIPKGGPCGGNGGKGGSVTFITDPNLYNLDHLKSRKLLKAGNGGDGGSNCRQGKQGASISIPLPVGTQIWDPTGTDVLFDLVEEKQKITICEGGKGGLGNDFFKSPTNRTPNRSTPGKDGEEKELILELKLLADIGLVGFPNAGKSTLLTALTAEKVPIGDYPFTTTTPNLSYIQRADYTRLFIADIPGIIEGAHENRGLGLTFLRHIERSRFLLFLIDIHPYANPDPEKAYSVLKNELHAYNPALLEKPSLVVLNKIDFAGSGEIVTSFLKKFPEVAKNTLTISAKEQINIDALKEVLETIPSRETSSFTV